MLSQVASSPPIAGKLSKTRLPILDGLRGVAALIVVAFHIFDSDPVNRVNHGYLAVDFFFFFMLNRGHFLKQSAIDLLKLMDLTHCSSFGI